MEKLVFRKFFFDTVSFFFISIVSISLIVWVIQAVNYLDFVSEDGHSFLVYYKYPLLNYPKILSRLIIFIFFISIFYTISTYEDKNELIIFWINGITKKSFLNFIIKFSFLLVIIQLVLNLLIVPKTQDMARSFLRTSNIDYFPSLIKSKKFVNTVENLTLFIEKKNENGELENIFLKDNRDKINSQIISAKRGLLKKKNEEFYLILFEGNIIDKNDNQTNILSYNETQINLSKYSTKSTIHPKIQELSTSLLWKCMIAVFKDNLSFIDRKLNCTRENVNDVNEELYKRAIVPFYLIIVAIIGSCLALRSETEGNLYRYKIFIFLSGILFIVLSQALSKYSGALSIKNLFLIFFPFLVGILIYGLIQLKVRE